MFAFSLDASAVAKRYVPEKGSDLVDKLFTRVDAARLYVANVGVAEVTSTIVRKLNGGRLSADGAVQAFADFYAELLQRAGINIYEIKNNLVIAAMPLIRRHSVNATDAIILRASLDLQAAARAVGDDLVLVAADDRLLRATKAEGLATFDPENQTTAELDFFINS